MSVSSTPPELLAPPPRPLPRWAPSMLSSFVRIALGALLLTIGSLVTLGGSRVRSLGDGIAVPGSVTKTWLVTNLGRTSAMAELRWNDDAGEAHVGLTRVSEESLETLPAGTPVGVYAVRVPGDVEATIDVGVPFKRREGARQLLLGVALCLGGLFLLLRAGVSDVRMRNLLSNGTMVTGRVLGARQRGSRVDYEFEAGGVALQGAANLTTRHKRELAASPREGDLAYVVFDPAHPKRSAVWGFSRVRTSAFEL